MLVILAWLAVCAVWDGHSREVPNWLTLPAIPIALTVAVLHGQQWNAVLGIGLLMGYLGLWHAGAVGGADAKIGLALTLFSPALGYAALAGLVLGGGFGRLFGRASIPAVPFMLLGAVAYWTIWSPS